MTDTGRDQTDAEASNGTTEVPQDAETDPPGPTGTSDRVRSIVADLSRDEKLALVRGGADPEGLATGYVPGNDARGIPPLAMIDGPMGVRDVPATAFPASIALAATWDPDLAREFGAALAAEAAGAGQDAVLAPGFNLLRVPQCGRAFEYYGEDPYLASRLAVGTIEGIQSEDVLATAKHFVANAQETDRHSISETMSERTLRELYLPAFEAAVREADVAAVMAAYNRINGTHATSHERLLREVLKGEWGFEGFVVSDWWATHDGPAAARAGLDLDMPGMPVDEWPPGIDPPLDGLAGLPGADRVNRWLTEFLVDRWQPPNPNPNVLEESPFGAPLRAALDDGTVPESVLDGMVARILGQLERFGRLDGERPAGSLDDPDHHDLARRIAERGTVLLRNRGETLPLSDDADVALIGPHADAAKVGGGGSSSVDPTRATNPLAGLRERVGDGGSVAFERGVDRVQGPAAFGPSLPSLSDLPIPGAGGPRVTDATTAARDADVAVVVVRDAATEGADRSLALPGRQDELIERVARMADRTVVVLNTAGPVETPWLDAVDAVLAAWYPGQEDGAALARVLFGDVDPSGRLPATFGASAADYPATSREQYPGIDGEAVHSEGVFVGYRHFDAEGVEPAVPFGHGESYAAFEYGDASLSVPDEGADAAAEVAVTVENVGDRPGREVVQCYVAPDDPPVERPPRELGAFAPLRLAPGEARTVTLGLDERAFAHYDETEARWAVAGGTYELLVGRSSRDVRARESVQMPET